MLGIILFKKLVKSIFSIRIMNVFTEKILVGITLIFITALLITQIGLLNKSTITYFSDIEKYEGIDINKINEQLIEGEITLELIGIEPSEEIKVLINGFEKYKFLQKSLNIKAKNNNLIEIDAIKVNKPFKVKISRVSENIVTNFLNKEISVNSNIVVLTRILINID